MFGLGKPTGDTEAVPRPGQRLLGLEPLNVGTSQEARPLPWLAGRQALGVTWITNAINPSAVPVTRRVVVGKGETQELTVAYLYDADMVCALCHGPVDTLHEIWMDEVLKWEGPADIALPFTPITVPDYGTVRIYPGSSNQNADPLLEPLGHPAYRGICYAVWEPLIFGRDRTSAPQIEFVLERKTQVPGWSNPHSQGDVCPLHAAVEMAAHPRYGGGVRFGEIDQDTLETISADLVTEDLLCSPLINGLAPLEQHLT